jgi:phosphoribosylformylglycinamidine synthase
MGSVMSSVLITGLGIIPDIRKTVSMDMKKAGNLIYLIGTTLPELGGSEYYRLKGIMGNSVPKVNAISMKKNMHSITEAIDLGLVKASHDLSEGGLGVALAEMAFSGGYGIDMSLKRVPAIGITRDDFLLFSESNSRFLLEIPLKYKQEFEKIMKHCVFANIGTVTENQTFVVSGLHEKRILDVSLKSLMKAWKKTFGDER